MKTMHDYNFDNKTEKRVLLSLAITTLAVPLLTAFIIGYTGVGIPVAVAIVFLVFVLHAPYNIWVALFIGFNNSIKNAIMTHCFIWLILGIGIVVWLIRG